MIEAFYVKTPVKGYVPVNEPYTTALEAEVIIW